MIVSTESKCAYTVFDSLEYICDKCSNTTLKVRAMNDLSRLEELFDYNCGDENDLICWKCSPNKKPKLTNDNNLIEEL